MIINVEKEDITKINSLPSCDYSLRFKELNSDLFMSLASNKIWPKSANIHRIVKTEEEKQYRAKCILSDLVNYNLVGKRFLDYGCGEGHIVKEALKMGAHAIGYSENPSDHEFITNDFSVIESNGPYDFILLYDSIDHIINSTHDTCIKINNLANRNGRVIIRTHPYTSIHGTHLHETLNMAYVHLFLTDEQISDLGGKQEQTVKLYNPEQFYTSIVSNQSLIVATKRVITNQLPQFIDQNDVLDYLLPDFVSSGIDTRQKLRKVLSIQNIDYCIVRV